MSQKNEPGRKGYSIRIFLAEGSPSGLKFVEKSNWVGLGVVCPRARFSEAKKRKEFDQAGVYLLLGASEASNLPTVYIGEADPIRPRLEKHHAQTDFWTTAFFFISKDSNLNKAHVEHLEHRLLVLAKEANRCELGNSNAGGRPSLSEADQADIETFFDEMLLCFPVLGVSIFEKPEERPLDRILLVFTRRGLVAHGYESDGFVVVKGSQASKIVVGSMQAFAQALRSDLLKKGVLVDAGTSLEFTSDYEFNSPSTAAYVVAGASVNGRDYWRTDGGKSLKQLQEEESK
ncbi:MAG TPA: GIY-YIG nuclease family protein [Chthoniobacterales bacterium]|jgi:hypothetical protein